MDEFPFVIYDREGEPISFERWSELFHTDYQQIALDAVEGYRVSTVWLGFSHLSVAARAPVGIFETMIFGEGWAREWQQRWDTEEEALAGHASAVATVTKGEVPAR
jgi:hypothetical protein